MVTRPGSCYSRHMSRDLPPELRYSSQYPWDLIQIDYCAGVLPISNICVKYGVTQSRLEGVARKYGWERRAAQPTVEEIFGPRTFGALPAPPGSEPVSLEEIRIAARDQARLILGEHRKDISALKGKLHDLMSRYEALACGANPNVPGVEGSEPPSLPVLGKNESPMDFLAKASQVMLRIVGLERQAYGLDVLVDPSDADSNVPGSETKVIDKQSELWKRLESLATEKASQGRESKSLDPAPVEATKH